MSEELKTIIHDLKLILEYDEIEPQYLDTILKKLYSGSVKHYLKSLAKGSKPERTLKEAFFGSTVLGKHLFKNIYPEVSDKSGFIDYVAEVKGEEISIEIKPLFKAIFEKDKEKRIFKKLKKTKLDWEDHREQIRKYLGRRGEFLIFTNLENWYFFSKTFSLDESDGYFKSRELLPLLKDLENVEDFWQYLDKQEDLVVKEPLDKKFFESLQKWVNELKKVEFLVEDVRKIELIINLINKFIFIQTLDKFWVIPSKYIKGKWSQIEREWRAKDKKRIVHKFLREINEYFYEFYDTELFRNNEDGIEILSKIEQSDKNYTMFFEKLKMVLGVDFGIREPYRGITQYNFRRIDEDILGKAYETFLAEIRKEKGIYYTPTYITKFITQKSVAQVCNNILTEFKENFEKENYKQCKAILNSLILIKILDPACGSGSFLIKSLKILLYCYKSLISLLEEREQHLVKLIFKGEEGTNELTGKINVIKKLVSIFDYSDDRDLISKIIIRHIFGVDLDSNALEIAKLNIWLEAIRLSPQSFRYDRLPADTNHILPDLEINLLNGDSLVGLPIDRTVEILSESHKDQLNILSKLRNEYLLDPTNEDVVKEINSIKSKLIEVLDNEFKEYIQNKKLSYNIILNVTCFHWALEYWFAFFDQNGIKKSKEDQGFDFIIGNPPWSAKIPAELNNLLAMELNWSKKNINICSLFMAKTLAKLKDNATMAFLLPKVVVKNKTYEIIRKSILDEYKIRLIADHGQFPEVASDAISLIINKSKAEAKTHILIFEPGSNKIIGQNFISQNAFLQFPSYVFSLYLNDEIIEILNEIKKDSIVLGDLFEVKRGIELGQKSRVVECESCKQINSIEKKYYSPTETKCLKCAADLNLSNAFTISADSPTGIYNRKCLSGAQLGKYETLGNYYIPEGLEGLNYKVEAFKRKKIILKRVSTRLLGNYSSDDDLYAFNTVYSIYKDDITEKTYLYLLGLLNSRLHHFFYEFSYNVGMSLTTQVTIDFLSQVPIRIKSNELEESISKNVEEIMKLKRLRNEFIDLWNDYSIKYRKEVQSLRTILLNDQKAIQQGNYDRIFTSDVNIYPESDSELIEREYERFRIYYHDDSELWVIGIKSFKEDVLLKITAKNEEFRDIIYLQLKSLFKSQQKIFRLKDIFNKTEIPVIFGEERSNIWERTPNLMKGTKSKFRNFLKSENITESFDIINLDVRISLLDSMINAYIFIIFGLNKKNALKVLTSLNISRNELINIMNEFDVADKRQRMGG